MNTKQLRLAALSLALLLPVSFIDAGCKGGKCRIVRHRRQAQAAIAAATPAPVAAPVATPAPVAAPAPVTATPAPVAPVAPAQTTEQAEVENDEENSSWMPWILGTAGLGAAAVAIWYFDVINKVKAKFSNSANAAATTATPAATTPATTPAATPAPAAAAATAAPATK